jgi:hypothetical protein
MVRVMVFNNILAISWWSVLLVEKTGISEKTTNLMLYRVHFTMSRIQTHNVSGDRH